MTIELVDPNKKQEVIRPIMPFTGIKRTPPKFEVGDQVVLKGNLYNTADEVRLPDGLVGTVIGDQGGYPHTVGVRFEGFALAEPINADRLEKDAKK